MLCKYIEYACRFIAYMVRYKSVYEYSIQIYTQVDRIVCEYLSAIWPDKKCASKIDLYFGLIWLFSCSKWCKFAHNFKLTSAVLFLLQRDSFDLVVFILFHCLLLYMNKRLMRNISESDLQVLNTLFRKAKTQLYTWYSLHSLIVGKSTIIVL